jgi:hypothetical protein
MLACLAGVPLLPGVADAQAKSRNAKYVGRLAFSYVMHHGFARFSSMKLFRSSPVLIRY